MSRFSRGMRTGASLVFDLDITWRLAFDRHGIGVLEDQVSSGSQCREVRRQRKDMILDNQ